MIGIRQLLKNLKTLWSNRFSLAKVIEILLNEKVDVATLKITRRLNARGHSTSAKICRPVDENNAPIPWYTYPLIDYINDCNTHSWKIIEFGSGQSTLFWAGRANKVISYENSKDWIDELEKRIPRNVELRFLKNLENLNNLRDLIFIQI